MSFGLSAAIIKDLTGVFARYPEIGRVLIFGSRAKGTFKEGSDIDLAVIAPNMSEQRFTQLWSELDGLPLVFKLDILHWDKLRNERLKLKITAEGMPFYPTEIP